MKLSSFVLLAIAFLLISPEIQGQDNQASVQGHVSTLWGEPLDNVVIKFYQLEGIHGLSASEKLIQQTTTNVQGRYKVTALPSGWYRVEIGRHGEEIWRFYLWRGANRVLDIGLPIGMMHHLKDITVTGSVRQRDNTPIEGATVTIMNAFNTREAQQVITDKAGNFKFELIQPGQYIVYATQFGFLLNATTLDLGNGSKERVNLRLKKDYPKYLKQRWRLTGQLQRSVRPSHSHGPQLLTRAR